MFDGNTSGYSIEEIPCANDPTQNPIYCVCFNNESDFSEMLQYYNGYPSSLMDDYWDKAFEIKPVQDWIISITPDNRKILMEGYI